MSWELQEAQQHFSELVRRANGEGPQLVTDHGRDAVVVMSVEDYQRLTGGQRFKDFLLQAPDWPDLELERQKTCSRKVES